MLRSRGSFLCVSASCFSFRAAYGNARTDIHACATLGIDQARTFILGKHGGEEGTVKLGEAFPVDLPAADPRP